MSDRIDAYIRGILAEVNDTERNGSPATDTFERWNDHGRQRDRCRYCGGKHDFNDCLNSGDDRLPWRGLYGPSFIGPVGFRVEEK